MNPEATTVGQNTVVSWDAPTNTGTKADGSPATIQKYVVRAGLRADGSLVAEKELLGTSNNLELTFPDLVSVTGCYFLMYTVNDGTEAVNEGDQPPGFPDEPTLTRSSNTFLNYQVP